MRVRRERMDWTGLIFAATEHEDDRYTDWLAISFDDREEADDWLRAHRPQLVQRALPAPKYR